MHSTSFSAPEARGQLPWPALLLIGGSFLAAAPAAAQSAPPAKNNATVPHAVVPPAVVPSAPPPPQADARLPEVPTIVTNEEIARDVPVLGPDDPELARPLESVGEFEAKIAPALAGTSPAPGSDPQINQPLPPLETFDVGQVDAAPPEPSTAAVELRYTTKVEGLEAADAATNADLAAQFRSLSALRSGGGKAANEAQLAARLQEDSKLIERQLHAEGWYDAKIDTRIDRATTGEGQPVTAVLLVTPGQRYTIGSITVTAAPTVPPGIIGQALALKVAEPIVAERIQGAEANVALTLPRQGYPFAQVGQRDVLLDPETHAGDYTLPVTVGTRARFGGFETTGDLAFDAHHVGVLARFKRGELYDSRQVDDLRQALVATGLFSAVAVEPRHSGSIASDGTEAVTMLVTQDAGPPRTIAASAGYGTGQGFRVEGSWTNRNFSRPEGALIATGVLGTAEQGASLAFRRSNAGKRDRTLLLNLEALHSDYKAFSAFTGRLAARLSYDSTPIWQKPFTWAVGAELLGTIEKDYDFAIGTRDSRKFLIAGVNGQVGIDRTNSLLDPTRGYRAQALVQPEGALSDGLRPYLRAQLDGSAYYPVGDQLVVAGRARVGSTVGIARSDLAPSRRFYAGGGGSVRGFGYQQLGPLDPDGRPLGGLSLVEGSAEVRYRFGNYGVAGFVDAGQVSSRSTPTLSGLRTGVGLGVRYYTNFGPVRIDVATPLGRRDGESRFNVYVSIGQAF